MIDLALEIAKRAHDGQKDKGGQDYINHPVTVASMLKYEDEKIVAYLHDTVEDTYVTLDYLKQCGFGTNIITAIDCITKRENENYENYIARLCTSKLAIKVKIADMIHNSDISRIPDPVQKDFDRVEKYKEKIQYLQSI